MKWAIYGKVVGSKYIGEVEADNQQEAYRLAQELPGAHHVSLCHHCSPEVEEAIVDELYVEVKD